MQIHNKILLSFAPKARVIMQNMTFITSAQSNLPQPDHAKLVQKLQPVQSTDL